MTSGRCLNTRSRWLLLGRTGTKAPLSVGRRRGTSSSTESVMTDTATHDAARANLEGAERQVDYVRQRLRAAFDYEDAVKANPDCQDWEPATAAESIEALGRVLVQHEREAHHHRRALDALTAE